MGIRMDRDEEAEEQKIKMEGSLLGHQEAESHL